MNDRIVAMEAQIRICLNKPYQKEHSVFDVGGFEFVVNGRNIPFDFDASGYQIQHVSDNHHEVIIKYSTGQGPFFNDWHLSEDFDAVYQDLGLARGDITAESLATTTEITEFFVNAEIDGEEALVCCALLSVSLQDDLSEYDVRQAVLDSFNAQQPLTNGGSENEL